MVLFAVILMVPSAIKKCFSTNSTLFGRTKVYTEFTEGVNWCTSKIYDSAVAGAVLLTLVKDKSLS